MRPICICHVCGGLYLPPGSLYYPTAGIWASLTECAGCMPEEGGPADPDTAGLRDCGTALPEPHDAEGNREGAR